jgi:ParB/RepB/Spo0J family partition protein
MPATKPRDSDTVGELKEVSLDSIMRNEGNPRLTFEERAIERLAASIADIGLLVPITVYENPRSTPKTYTLLDGERRFRAAKLINKPSIPALVVPRPTQRDNAVRMFNIHMLREDWEEIETAWALEQIMEKARITNERELHDLTGLSVDRIRNMKRVLAFPRSVQERVSRGELKYQMLVELDKNVLSRTPGKSTKSGGKPVLELSTSQLRDVFLKKYETGVESDIVDLRRVGTLIDTARGEGKIAKRAQSALATLVTAPQATIEDAYETGAASSVELSKVIRDLSGLPGRVDDLLTTLKDKDERRQVAAALQEAMRRLQKCLDRAVK